MSTLQIYILFVAPAMMLTAGLCIYAIGVWFTRDVR